MKKSTEKLYSDILKKNDLTYLEKDFVKAVNLSIERVSKGGKIVVCGNGGSCSDSLHIVGELMKGFVLKRELNKEDKEKFVKAYKGDILAEKLQYGIPAVALTGTEAISTAIINDNGAEMMFAQQAYALLNKEDIFIGISTSGNAENVSLALSVAKTVGALTIGLSGKTGGKLKELSDVSLTVSENETYRIQEKHLPIYHAYCLCLENEFFGD